MARSTAGKAGLVTVTLRAMASPPRIICRYSATALRPSCWGQAMSLMFPARALRCQRRSTDACVAKKAMS